MEHKYWKHTKEGLEEDLDVVKVSVLKVLVRDGLLDVKTADKWCEEHGIILLKKTMFRSISNLWRDDKVSVNNHFIHVVELDVLRENEEETQPPQPPPPPPKRLVIEGVKITDSDSEEHF